MSKVLIEINGGAVTHEEVDGDVEVCIIDWDNIKAGDDPPYNWEDFIDLGENLRKNMDEVLKEKNKHGKIAS